MHKRKTVKQKVKQKKPTRKSKTQTKLKTKQKKIFGGNITHVDKETYSFYRFDDE